MNDNANGDQTVIYFPTQFAFPAASNGDLKLKSDTHAFCTLLFGLFGACGPTACSSLETISVKIVDPLGRPFATIGSSTR